MVEFREGRIGLLGVGLGLKFLSVADLAYGWRLLDREAFIVLWIVIFSLLGVYLLGKIKFSHDSEVKYVSVPRLFMAIISFAFAIYMVPGLWGAPLRRSAHSLLRCIHKISIYTKTRYTPRSTIMNPVWLMQEGK